MAYLLALASALSSLVIDYHLALLFIPPLAPLPPLLPLPPYSLPPYPIPPYPLPPWSFSPSVTTLLSFPATS